MNTVHVYFLCFNLDDLDGEAEEEHGGETKAIWSTYVALSCLGNPALPCAQGKEQVLSWTQEREERQNREGRRRGAALTDPQSPETMTDCNHRLSQPTLPTHTADTPINVTRALFSTHLLKSSGKHARTAAQCSASSSWVHGRVMFVWNIFIPPWLHHSAII